MSSTLSSLRRPELYLHLLKPPRHSTLPLRHHLSAGQEASSPPDAGPQDEESLVNKIAQYIKETPEQEWGSSETLSSLLLSPAACSSPRFLSDVVRCLPDSSIAFSFVDYLQLKSPSLPGDESISIAFQSVLDIASREPVRSNGQPHRGRKLLELYKASKEKNIALTVNAVKLLIRFLGRDGMVDESIMVYEEMELAMRNTHVRNVLLDVFLSSGRMDHALKVLDEMLEPDSEFPPNGITGDIVFNALRKNTRGRQVDEEEIIELVSKFKEHGVFPSSYWLTQFITRLCRKDQSHRAWGVLEQQMKHNACTEAACCNTLLSALGRSGDVDKMNQLLRKMKEMEVRPNVVTFGIIVNNLCKLRRVDEALEIVEKMQDGKDGIVVEPDVITYNTLIDGFCKAGRLEEAQDLVERMRKQKSCPPNLVTYNSLIDGFCRAGQIDIARKLLYQMKEAEVEPNVVSLNAMIGGLCRHGRIHSAIELFDTSQREGLKGNVVTYTILINALCNAGNINKATEFFDNMLEAKCSPDARVYYALISGLCQGGRLNDASSVVSKLKKAGFCLDLVGYNMLISGFCQQNKFDKVREMIVDMEEARVKPDTITYNTLISFFSRSGDFSSAHTTMRKMIQEGLTPTVVTYGALIHAYCIHGEVNEAMKIYEDMSSRSKVTPNTVIYNILIDSLCKNNNVDRAFSLMDDMKVKGVRPDTNTYNAMLKGLRDKNQLDKAFKLMDKMTEHSCAPNHITMEVLTEWLSAVGKTEKLKRFLQGYTVSSEKHGIAFAC